MEPNGVAETLRQIRDGRDFSPPKAILRISAERAVLRGPAWPYSIADNVAHTVYWQDLWLARLRGSKINAVMGEDWPTVMPEGWSETRERFLRGLDEAIAIAEAGGEVHTLARIAHHNAYHVGQWALLKRLSRDYSPNSR
ncbi:DinB family protein [bacterium]|nr:MAG: DinB family protein [bacterium]